MKCLQNKLSMWARRIRNERIGVEESLSKKLEHLMTTVCNNDKFADIIQTKFQLNLEIEKELYWEQWARVNWFRNEDKKMSFFHK